MENKMLSSQLAQRHVMSMTASFILFAIVQVVSAEPDDINNTLAARLQKVSEEVLSEYNAVDRPRNIEDEEAPTKVSISMEMPEKFEDDAVAQTITLTYLMCATWTDPRIKWNSTEVPNNHMFVSRWRVWKPRLNFLNAISSSTELDLPIALSKHGSVIHCNKYRIVVPCFLNLHAFPYDVNNCTIMLGSSIYGSKDVVLVDGSYQFQRAYKYGIWMIAQSEEIQEVHSISKGIISTLIVTLKLSRNFGIYGVQIYLALWASLFLLTLTLLTSGDYQRPLSCITLLGASVQHNFLATLIKGATSTPLILLISSGVVTVCFMLVWSLHIRLSFRSNVSRPFMVAVTGSILPIFEMTILLPATGLLAIVLLFA